MTWETYLLEKAQVIEAALEKLLPAAASYPPAIHRAMRYSLMGGGKRLRPVLTLAAAEAVGAKVDDALAAACAVEMIHTYSLIHDDLPAMDDDNYRRGQPTCHRVFGEAVAILAGDALLTQAFIVLSETALRRPDLQPQYVAVMAELSRAAGSEGLIGGQVVDLEATGQQIEPGVIEYIDLHKTGALLQAAIVAGGIIGRCSQAQLDILRKYGTHLGLAFQITDDILDLTGDPQLTGKDAASDLRQGKATYPAIYGLEAARKRVAEEVARAGQSLAGWGGSGELLVEAARWIGERDK